MYSETLTGKRKREGALKQSLRGSAKVPTIDAVNFVASRTATTAQEGESYRSLKGKKTHRANIWKRPSCKRSKHRKAPQKGP